MMSRIVAAAVLPVLLASVGCLGIPTLVEDPSSGGNKYDGTYDFSFTYTGPGGGLTTVPLSRFFLVTNANISSSDNTLRGAVSSDFGQATFVGPCPVNDGNADFTGTLNALSGPKFGQGTYRCRIGGASSSWRVYNGS